MLSACQTTHFDPTTMSQERTQLPLPLPEAVRPWLVLNTDFHVIICCAPECQQVLSFKGIEDHLLRKHQLQRHVRQELASS